MIAVDTNILVYAHREECEQHKAAAAALRKLAEGNAQWGVPVFVVGEFLRVVTHGQAFRPPSQPRQALHDLDAVLASPTVQVLVPGDRYLDILRETVLAEGIRGNLVYDAQIAAVCLERGATEILTEDRDFERFPGIRVRRLS